MDDSTQLQEIVRSQSASQYMFHIDIKGAVFSPPSKFMYTHPPTDRPTDCRSIKKLIEVGPRFTAALAEENCRAASAVPHSPPLC